MITNIYSFIYKNKNLIIILSLFFIWALGNIPTLLHFKILYTHADWKLSQYHVNYFDHGFVRRGIVGSFLYPITKNLIEVPDRQKLLIFWKETFFFFIYGFIFCKFIIKKTFDISPKLTILLLGSLLLSPCGLIQASYDFGRYDHINFILLAISIYLLENNKLRITSLILALAVLVHENSIFYLHPIITSISLKKIKSSFRILIRFILPSIFTTLLVFIFGDKPVLLPDTVSLGVGIWGEGLNLYILNLGQKTFDVIIFSVYIILCLSCLIYFYKLNRLNIDSKFIACFSPLPLFIIAADWGRWVHYLFLLIVIVICYKANELRNIKINNFFLSILILLGIPLGPMGVGYALPYVQLMIEKIS